MLRKLGTLALVLLLNAPVQAQVSPAPSTLNYQGRLTTPSGNPVPDGTYSIRFSLWNVASGGVAGTNEKWNKTVSNVMVKNGTFAVALNTFPAGTFDGDLWLEIKVGSDAALTPRQPLASVAYALKANTVPDGSLTINKFAPLVLNFNAWVLGGNSGVNSFLGTLDANPLAFRTNDTERLRILSGGNVGIGTATPGMSLEVTSPSYYAGPANGVSYDASRYLYLHGGAGDHSLIWNNSAALRFGSDTSRGVGYVEHARITPPSADNVDQSQTAFPNTLDANFSNDPWQTFQPSRSGLITKIRAYTTTSSTNGQILVNLYRGQTNTGTALRSDSFLNQTGALQWRDFPLTTPLYVVANQTYTFKLVGGATLRAGFAQGDLYLRGRSSISTTTDLAFEIVMSNAGGTDIQNSLNIATSSAAPAGLNITNTNDNNYAIRLKNANTGLETGMFVTDTGFFQITNNMNGGAFARLDSTGIWTSTSDRRLKSDIQPLGDLLDKALQLKPVSYYFTAQDKQRDPNRHMGFIAQDVETLFPSLVSGSDTKTLNYTGLSVVAIGALQEMNRQMLQDRKRVESLEAENAELKRRLEAIEAALAQHR